MTRVDIVQNALGVTLPLEYVTFLDEYGVYEADGVEVYGYDEEIVDVDQIPCVIGATKMLWKDYPELAGTYLSLHFTGTENEQVVLDTATGHICMVTDDSNTQIADSFEEWFSRDVVLATS